MKRAETKNELPPDRREKLLGALKTRFKANPNRHEGFEWVGMETRLRARPEKLRLLHEMESTDGEPDVAGRDPKTGEYLFFDCSRETPKVRTSVCYDREGLEPGKEHKPKTSAMDMAAAMGVKILTKEQYHDLQKLGEFDTRTSSWVKTPGDIRKLGGALFCDRRFVHVFTYHNGARSYYNSGAFRSSLRV